MGRHLGRFSEIQTVGRRPAPLVYFDRPCRVSGTVSDKAGKPVHVNIEIPGAGFHLLEYVQLPERGHSLVTAAKASDLVFVTTF